MKTNAWQQSAFLSVSLGVVAGGVIVEIGLECDEFGKHEGEESIKSKDIEVGML